MNQKAALDWGRFWERIAEAKVVALMSHVRPDGDSLGSQLALAEALDALGKTTLCVNADPVPPSLAFLDPDHRIQRLADLTASERAEWDKADLLISLDTSARAQLGAMAELFIASKAQKLVVDHHVQRNELEAEFFVNPDAEATGVLVFDALVAGKIPLTDSIAFKLFTAIATDTGWFRFSSVTPETYEKAAALCRAGVRPDAAYKVIYEQESLGRLRLVGRALMKTESLLDGKLMFTSLLNDDFAAAGAHPSDSEDIVNRTLQVGGSEMAIIMVERPNGGFKISFRSRCQVDCARLAARFDGGGHQAAAGAFLDLPYDEAKKKILEGTLAEWEAS